MLLEDLIKNHKTVEKEGYEEYFDLINKYRIGKTLIELDNYNNCFSKYDFLKSIYDELVTDLKNINCYISFYENENTWDEILSELSEVVTFLEIIESDLKNKVVNLDNEIKYLLLSNILKLENATCLKTKIEKKIIDDNVTENTPF